MVTHYLIKTHSFLTQQLNIYSLKDLSSLLFSEFSLEPLNPFRRFLKCFIIFTFYFILYLFYFCLVPGILELWCLVTATFKFTVFYNNIYKKKKTLLFAFLCKCRKQSVTKIIENSLVTYLELSTIMN